MNLYLKRCMQTIFYTISRGSLIQCSPGSYLEVGKEQHKYMLFHWTHWAFFSCCAAVSPVINMARTLEKGQKEVLFPLGGLPVQFDEVLGSSNFSLSALLSAAFSQCGRDSFHLEFSNTQLCVFGERWIWARERGSCAMGSTINL